MDLPFNDRGVSVTRTALSAAGQVFPLRDIADVRIKTVRKNRVVPYGISIAGVIVAIVGGLMRTPAALVCGIMLVVVGWLTWITQDVTYRLLVQTPAGEREALSSVERAFVERVEQAVRAARAAADAAATPLV